MVDDNDDNSTLELVCVVTQFSNVINSASFSVQFEEREKESSFNEDVENDI